jgi:DNA-binding NarL/FixJ family response regulator
MLLSAHKDLEVVGGLSDPDEARQWAAELCPDIVLMALRPHDSGAPQGIVRLRDAFPRAQIIILGDDQGDEALVYQAIKAGAMGCVAETADSKELIAAIRGVAHGEGALSSTFVTRLINVIASNSAAHDPHNGTVDHLTTREREILDLTAAGWTNREIAAKLVVSESTVRSHLHHILDKLHLTNRVQVAAYAFSRTRAAHTER